jgi:hypothetical protein
LEARSSGAEAELDCYGPHRFAWFMPHLLLLPRNQAKLGT